MPAAQTAWSGRGRWSNANANPNPSPNPNPYLRVQPRGREQAQARKHGEDRGEPLATRAAAPVVLLLGRVLILRRLVLEQHEGLP